MVAPRENRLSRGPKFSLTFQGTHVLILWDSNPVDSVYRRLSAKLETSQFVVALDFPQEQRTSKITLAIESHSSEIDILCSPLGKLLLEISYAFNDSNVLM